MQTFYNFQLVQLPFNGDKFAIVLGRSSLAWNRWIYIFGLSLWRANNQIWACSHIEEEWVRIIHFSHYLPKFHVLPWTCSIITCSLGDPIVGHIGRVGSTAWSSQQCNCRLFFERPIRCHFRQRSHRLRVPGLSSDKSFILTVSHQRTLLRRRREVLTKAWNLPMTAGVAFHVPYSKTERALAQNSLHWIFVPGSP